MQKLQIATVGALLFALQVSGGATAAQDAQALSAPKALVDSGHLSETEQILRSFLAAHRDSGDVHFLLGYVLFRQIQTKASVEGHTDPKHQEENAKAALAEFTAGAKYKRPGAFELKIVALSYVLCGDYTQADKWLR
jgi:hypothetical protein